MRVVVTLVAATIGFSISSTARAQTHNVSEWRVTDVAQALLKFVIEVMSERLSFANRAISALQR
jgi:hypothetical protein